MSLETSMHRHYSKAYKDRLFLHDSPDKSRSNMCRRIMDVLKASPHPITVLNVGSGPQALEHQLLSFRSNSVYKRLIDQTQFITLDLATIPQNRLMMRKYTNTIHVQANSLNLPFASNALDLVVSNMSLDFIYRNEYNRPYNEVFRILKPGGSALFSFHHPRLYSNQLLNGEIYGNGTVEQHWRWLHKHHILFHTEDEIRICLEEKIGFNISSIECISDSEDTWWETTVQKPL